MKPDYAQVNGVLPDPGQLDHVITIVEKVTTQDNYGGEVITWTPLDGDDWAKMEYRTGAESQAHTTEINTQEVIFTIQYRGNLNTSMRVIHETDYFDIVAIKPLGMRVFEELTTVFRSEQINYLTDADGNPLTDDDGNILTQ